MSDEVKLLPCPLPWCGKAREGGWRNRELIKPFDPDEPWPVTMSRETFGHDEHWVRCNTCGMDSPTYATEAEAIAAWNTRAIEATRPTEQGLGGQPRLMSDEAKSGATVLVYFKHYGWLTVEWNNRFLDMSEPVTLENGIWCVNDHKNDVWHLRGYCEGDDTYWMPLPDAPEQEPAHD